MKQHHFCRLWLFLLIASLSGAVFGQDTIKWVEQRSGVNQTLWSIYFADTLHGWAVGNNSNAVRTDNGGATWTRITAPSGDSLYTVWFVTPAKGWMAGVRGAIYVSADSGKSWVTDTSKLKTYFADAWFFNEDSGLFVGSTNTNSLMGTVFRTVDGGQTWSETDMSNPWGLGSVMFVNDSTGWATGADLVVKSNNGGQSWGAPVDPITASYRGYVNVIWFIDSLRGFGAGRYGGIVTTADGGATWSCVDTSTGSWLEDICFTDPRHGVVVGERGCIGWSSDSGRTWVRHYPRHLPTLDAPWFRTVCFRDAGHIWTAGDSGLIMKGAFSQSVSVDWNFNKGIPGGKNCRLSVRQPGIVTVDFYNKIPASISISLYGLDGAFAGQIALQPQSSIAHAKLPDLKRGVYLMAAEVDGLKVAERFIYK